MRKDPYTGELFDPKRNNQVYANRKNQIDHNNKKAREERNRTNVLDRRLKDNRILIIELIGEDNSVVLSKEYLKGKGFDLSIFNRMLMIDQVQAYGIYEYYLKPVDSVNVEIGKIR